MKGQLELYLVLDLNMLTMLHSFPDCLFNAMHINVRSLAVCV